MIAQCSEEPGFILAPIDLSLIKSIRQSMPLECHRRYDIYPKMISCAKSNKLFDDSYEFKFGESAVVKGFQVFFRTELCLAFTNIRCVLPGRILFINFVFTYFGYFVKYFHYIFLTRCFSSSSKSCRKIHRTV